MPTVKLTNKLSDEEITSLIENIGNVDKEVINIAEKDSTDIIEFISFFQFEDGDYLVTDALIYKLYYSWSQLKLNKTDFFTTFHQYFTRVTRNKFSINKDKLNVSESLFKFLTVIPSKKKVPPTYLHHGNLYLRKYDIKPGENKINSEVLYYLYDLWTYKTKYKNPLNRSYFYRVLRLNNFKRQGIFPPKIYFFLDNGIFNHITMEEINKIETNRRMYYEKKKSSYKNKSQK
jgi:hypothetical protein